jgi:hypothetical protein
MQALVASGDQPTCKTLPSRLSTGLHLVSRRRRWRRCCDLNAECLPRWRRRTSTAATRPAGSAGEIARMFFVAGAAALGGEIVLAPSQLGLRRQRHGTMPSCWLIMRLPRTETIALRRSGQSAAATLAVPGGPIAADNLATSQSLPSGASRLGSKRQFIAGLLREHVLGIPVRPVDIVLAAVRFSCSPCAAAARRSAVARSLDDANVVSASTRPGNRVVTPAANQPLPSGSPKI